MRGRGMVWEPVSPRCPHDVPACGSGGPRWMAGTGATTHRDSHHGPQRHLRVLDVLIPTGASCWKTLEILGTGTAEELPQPGATQALGSFCG